MPKEILEKYIMYQFTPEYVLVIKNRMAAKLTLVFALRYTDGETLKGKQYR